MKKFTLFLAILIMWVNLSAQPYYLHNYQFVSYGRYLINASNNDIVATLNKTYYANAQENHRLVLSDSSNVYFLDSLSHGLVRSFHLETSPIDYIKLACVKQDTLQTLYAFSRSTFDTLRIYQFDDTTVLDTITFDSVSSPVSIVYTDTSHFLLSFVNVKNQNAAIDFTFYFIKFDAWGMSSVDTVHYTIWGQNFLFPVQSFLLSQNMKHLIILSSSGTYDFRLSSTRQVQSYKKYNIISGKTTLANNTYLFVADERKIKRINLMTEQIDEISLPSNAKSILFAPNASLLITFYGTADSTLGVLYNPLADSAKNTFFRYSTDRVSQQIGGVLTYVFRRPWMDFNWRKDPSQKNKYIFSIINGVGFEPDTIRWYIDGHFVGKTTRGNHSLVHVFFRKGDYMITAKAYYAQDHDSVIVKHYFRVYYDMFPNIIKEDTMLMCDLPDFYIDLQNYSYGSDSIVWLRNYEKFPDLRNKAYAHITKPGLYWVYIYLPDTVLSDTVSVLYLDKEFKEQDIKLYVNNSLYQSDNNVYCSNDGNVYFEFKLPHPPTCEHNYLVYWYFGDNSTKRTSQLYTDHKYYNPGTYTVLTSIRDTKTGAAYNYIFTINVSINPIQSYPKVINIQKLSAHKLYVGHDYIIAHQKIVHDHIFYTNYGQQVPDTTTITIPITDKHYWSLAQSSYTFWAFLGSTVAEGVEIRLFNSRGDSITLMPNQDTVFPNTSFFYGRPKINIPHFPAKDESTYPYFWNDESALTMWYMTHTTQSTSGIFAIFKYFVEEYELLDWYHYQLYTATLHPYGKMSSLSSSGMGQEWKVKFILHSKDPGRDRLRVQAVGLKLPSYYTYNNYTYNWTSDTHYVIDQDSIVKVESDYQGKYNLQFMVTDALGCTYKTNTQIYVLDTLGSVLPDVFTPNGDGVNDRWDLRRAFYNQIYEQDAPVEVKIWDKYGRVVADFMANDVKQWDGKDKNGNKLPPGTYWYLITVANKQHYKGYVTILY